LSQWTGRAPASSSRHRRWGEASMADMNCANRSRSTQVRGSAGEARDSIRARPRPEGREGARGSRSRSPAQPTIRMQRTRPSIHHRSRHRDRGAEGRPELEGVAEVADDCCRSPRHERHEDGQHGAISKPAHVASSVDRQRRACSDGGRRGPPAASADAARAPSRSAWSTAPAERRLEQGA